MFSKVHNKELRRCLRAAFFKHDAPAGPRLSSLQLVSQTITCVPFFQTSYLIDNGRMFTTRGHAGFVIDQISGSNCGIFDRVVY